jgi:hypothetical protein
MACDLLNGGIARGCDNNQGGITKLYLANFDDVLTETVASGEVTAITMATGEVFYEFAFNKNTSSLTQTITNDQVNGTTIHTQTINLVIPRRDNAKRNAIATLTRSLTKAIVLDSNGIYWYCGAANGLDVTEIADTTGVVKSDLNGYNITLVGEEPVMTYTVASGVVTTVTA